MRVRRTILLVVSCAMLAAGTAVAQQTPTPEPLTPVQRRAVRLFIDDGILSGTSCSIRDCSGTVERWEVALWIVRLLDGKPTSHRAFVDVDSEQPYAGYVQTMFDLGVTVGCMVDPLRYCPNQETKRGQMAAFVTRAYDLDDVIPPHGFSDVPRAHTFWDNISALKNAGVLSSDCADGEGLFCPDDPIVAAKAVEWLYRASRLDTTDSRNGGGGGVGGRGGGGGSGGGGGGNGGGGNGGGNGGGGGGGNGDATTTTSSTTSTTTTTTTTTSSTTSTTTTTTTTTSSTTSTTTTTTTIPVGDDGPGGAEIDIGPEGECTHWYSHARAGGGDVKSHVLLSEDLILDDGRTLDAGLYAHRHDGDVLRWWYWPQPINGEQQGVTNLPEGDPRIPCDHEECPTDHDHDGMGRFEYLAGSHYFGEDSHRARRFVYQEDGTWRLGDSTESIANRDGPCLHPMH